MGKGPEWGGNSNITTAHLSTYDDLAEFLQKEAAKQSAMELTVIGQSVKGRDLYLASWISDPAKPTILHPTTPNAPAALVERSKRLGAVVYESVEAKGWGKIAKYGGGSAETISRNGIAVVYGVATLLFEIAACPTTISRATCLVPAAAAS